MKFLVAAKGSFLALLLSLAFLVSCDFGSGPGKSQEPAPETGNPDSTLVEAPAVVPSAPRKLTAEPGNLRVTVRWLVPENNGGSEILHYVVMTLQDTSKQCHSTGPLECTLFGLSNGVPYTFAIYATNRIGRGPEARTSDSAIPRPSPPDAPTSVYAVSVEDWLRVTWIPPVSNGGAPILGYEVVAVNFPGIGCRADSLPVCEVRGLTAGTSYRFRVRAINEHGSGPASKVSPPAIAIGLPSPPGTVTAAPIVGGARIYWSAAFNGGSEIVLYQVVASSDTTIKCETLGSLSCVLTGFTPGSSQTFKVRAINAFGAGLWSSSSPVMTVPTVPGVPTNVQAVPGILEAVVSWTDANPNGAPITRYTVTAVEDTSKKCVWISPARCTVTGLTAKSRYTFTVTATNGVGDGPTSLPSASVEILPPLDTVGPVWTTRMTVQGGMGWSDVSWSGSQFIAVGNDGSVARSLDGVTWSRQTISTKRLAGITWTGSRFVAVGSGILATSQDGIVWVEPNQALAQNYILDDVVWTGTQLIALNYDGRSVLVSPNGVDWSVHSTNTPSIPRAFWTGTQLIAVGAGTVLSSPNGIDWTTRFTTNQSLNGITWSGNEMVAVGSGGTVWISSDGFNWVSRSFITKSNLYAVVSANGKLYYGGSEGGLFQAEGNQVVSFRSGTTQIIRAIVSTGTRLVAVGGGGTILTSP